MSLCSHCRTLTTPTDDGGVLRLSHPLPHTIGKLRKVLADHYQLEPAPRDAVAVVLPPGVLENAVRLLEQHLSTSERQDCSVLFLAEGEALDFDKMSRVQPLDTFLAKARAGWLVEMLERDNFYMDFQPIVPAASPDRVFAYECLLRGRDTQDKTVPPGLIFEAARSAKLLFQLDRAARLTAIRDASTHGIETPIFINFNPTSIYDPAFCLRTTIAAIKEAGIAPDRIVFEVVESDAVRDTDHLLNIVRFYRQQGFRIALDDLGAGYGSLNLLSQLKPDFVKFDRELIRGVDGDPYKQKVFVKLIEMAHDLGIHTLAEGVETEGEYRWLTNQGVEYLQGYFFARPASPPPAPRAEVSQILYRPPRLTPSHSVPLPFRFGMEGDALLAVLDSLQEQVAVIDASGKIMMVNRAWRHAGTQNGVLTETDSVGVNYLDICRAAGNEGSTDALKSYQGLRSVLDGENTNFSFEYRCDTPQGVRWFLMNATPLAGEHGGAVVLHVDITERKAQEAQVSRLARQDELTGAANRRHFYEKAQQTLARAEHEGLRFSLLYLDLDDFKGVNDRHGHAAGDALLRLVSARLQRLTRADDLLARFGGDEFVLLLHDVPKSELTTVVKRYQKVLMEPFLIEGMQLTGVGSLGAAAYPEHGLTVDELLRSADAAMYRKKTLRPAGDERPQSDTEVTTILA
jgi:diguanylate cyclase (GGDEF)-like protein